MVKKTCQCLEALNYDVRTRIQAQITILVQDKHETDAKNQTLMNSAAELTNPLEMVKKTCQSLESLNYDVRARIQAQITILGQDKHETDAKNRTLTNSASELTNHLEMVKKTCNSVESLNYDFRARIQAKITIFILDKHETDTKSRTLTNSASELTNPLGLVKKRCQSLESLNYDVRARIQAQITILGQDKHETDAKNWTLTNSASELTIPFQMVKKTCQSSESLNYDVRARIQARIIILGQHEHETDAKNRTLTNSTYELTNPLEMVKKNMSVFGIAQL